MGAPKLSLCTFLLSETVLLLLLVVVAELLFPLLGFPLLPQLLWLWLLLLLGCWTFKVGVVDLSTAPETPPTRHSVPERRLFGARFGNQAAIVISVEELYFTVHSLIRGKLS